jgi:hypothetical protein
VSEAKKHAVFLRLDDDTYSGLVGTATSRAAKYQRMMPFSTFVAKLLKACDESSRYGPTIHQEVMNYIYDQACKGED